MIDGKKPGQGGVTELTLEQRIVTCLKIEIPPRASRQRWNKSRIRKLCD